MFFITPKPESYLVCLLINVVIKYSSSKPYVSGKSIVFHFMEVIVCVSGFFQRNLDSPDK